MDLQAQEQPVTSSKRSTSLLSYLEMSAPDNLSGYVQSSHGFVNTVQIDNTSGSPASALWNKSTSVSFVLFMVIGFCATLAAIGLCVGAYLLFR